jgi:antitoxin component HigA of HigAB toxin-antitoxin module
MWKFLKATSSRKEVVTSLQAIVDGEDYVWSDFTDIPIEDPRLDQIRLRVLALESSHPPVDANSYLSPEGIEIVQSIIQDILSEQDGSQV